MPSPGSCSLPWHETTALDPTGAPPPPTAPDPDDDGGDGRDDDARGSSPVVGADDRARAGVVFAGAAGMYWWDHRPAQPNTADVGFYDDMTVHHQQAIDMALVYLRNGTKPLLRHMADEIVLFQAGDIRTMQTALQDWNKSPDETSRWRGWARRCRRTNNPGWRTRANSRALHGAAVLRSTTCSPD